MAIYLIDFENRPKVKGFSSLSEDDKVFIFHSEKEKLTFEQHDDLDSAVAQIKHYEVQTGSKDALDKQLIFVFGYLAAKYPEQTFYIVSQDQGYEVLKKLCGELKLSCQQIPDLTAAQKKQKTKGKEKTEIKEKKEETEAVEVKEEIKEEIKEDKPSVDLTDALKEELRNSGTDLTEEEIEFISSIRISLRDLMGMLKKRFGGDAEKAKAVKTLVEKFRKKNKIK